MAELKEHGEGSQPQNPEWKHDFSPGPSEEEIARFKGPEWRSELPDIKMLVDKGDEGKEEGLDPWRLFSGRATTTSINKLTRALEAFEKAPKRLEEAQKIEDETKRAAEIKKIGEEREVQAEKTRQHYATVMSQCLDSISSMFDETIDQKKNPYPYDHRTPKITIETVRESFAGLEGEDWLKSEESRLWLKRAERDLDWLDAFLQVSVAQAVSAPYYYDVVLQLQVLKDSRFRAYTTEETLERMFAGEVPGLEFKDEELVAVNENKVGIAISPKHQEGRRPLVEQGEVVGLRELAVKMQDDSFDIRMKIAAVSQSDLALLDKTFMGKSLRPGEWSFYKELLWDKGQILSPYISSTAKDQRKVTAIIEALLLTNARARLNQIISGRPDEKDGEITALLNAVRDVAQEREKSWFSRDKGDIASQLAVLITRQGFLQDYSFMHAYRYCWAYQWNEKDQPQTIKEIKTGSINTPSGDIYSLYWARRAHSYDLESNSRTQLLFPTEREMRVGLKRRPLGEMDVYNPDSHLDVFLKKQWSYLFGSDIEAKQWRGKREYPDIPAHIADTLKSWAWLWRTPYPLKLLGEDLEDKHKLDIVMLMPPGFAAANFFENVKVGEKEDSEEEDKKTVWELIAQGTPLSRIRWKDMDVQQVDRWLVDQEMGSRFMRILIEPFDPEKDPFYGLVTHAPATLGPKEAAKRLRLCFRDNPEVPYSVYELAFIPFLVTLACANKWGITSPEAWEHSSVTSEEVAKTTHTKIDRFLEEMAYWRRALAWLPGERGIGGGGGKKAKVDWWEGGSKKIKIGEDEKQYTHYGEVMAMIGEFYQNMLLRYGKAASEEAYPLANQRYDQSKADYKGKDFEFLRRGNVPKYEPRVMDLKK